MKIPDKELALRAKDGELKAYEALFERYQSKIYNFAYSIVDNTIDAKAIAKESFIRVYEALSKVDESVSNFSSYLYKTTKILVIDELRRKRGTADTEHIDIKTQKLKTGAQAPLVVPDSLKTETMEKISRIRDYLNHGQKIDAQKPQIRNEAYVKPANTKIPKSEADTKPIDITKAALNKQSNESLLTSFRNLSAPKKAMLSLLFIAFILGGTITGFYAYDAIKRSNEVPLSTEITDKKQPAEPKAEKPKSRNKEPSKISKKKRPQIRREKPKIEVQKPKPSQAKPKNNKNNQNKSPLQSPDQNQNPDQDQEPAPPAQNPDQNPEPPPKPPEEQPQNQPQPEQPAQ